MGIHIFLRYLYHIKCIVNFKNWNFKNPNIFSLFHRDQHISEPCSALVRPSTPYCLLVAPLSVSFIVFRPGCPRPPSTSIICSPCTIFPLVRPSCVTICSHPISSARVCPSSPIVLPLSAIVRHRPPSSAFIRPCWTSSVSREENNHGAFLNFFFYYIIILFRSSFENALFFWTWKYPIFYILLFFPKIIYFFSSTEKRAQCFPKSQNIIFLHYNLNENLCSVRSPKYRIFTFDFE